MKGKATQKGEGGKLITIEAVFGLRLEEVKITGDFFLHPEETIRAIEQCLLERSIDEIKARTSHIVQDIDGVLRANKASLIGVSPQDVLETLKEAIR